MLTESEAGVLLVDKPDGKTSFSVVRAVRRILGIKKVGHAGTLDPFATGLLVVCVGRPATRMISEIMEGVKEYQATLMLGAVSTTQDPEGIITAVAEETTCTGESVRQVLERFKGVQLQKPPAYSALKHKGKPLYHYARQGIKIDKEPRQIHIHALDWLDEREQVEGISPTITIRVVCSKGTYIRTLGADIGEALGCGAYLSSLRRVRSGMFSIEDAVSGSSLYGTPDMELIKNSILSVEHVRNLLQ